MRQPRRRAHGVQLTFVNRAARKSEEREPTDYLSHAAHAGVTSILLTTRPRL